MNFSAVLSSPFIWFMMAFGACVGSFLNVCILRIPEGTFFKHHRSVCPACGAVIPAYFNVPILSYFMLRGKAACCKAALSIQYPLVELVTLIIFAYGYWVFPFLGWSLNVPHWDLHEFVRYMHSMIFISLLLVCSVIDLRLMIIPDVISLPMIAMTPLIALVHPDLDMKSALIGVVLGGGFLYFVAWAYWLIRKEYGMGFGDVKLLAAIGGWLGYQAILPTLFIGSMVGSVVGIVFLIVARRFSFKAQIPFGPFLAVGAVTYLWWGPLLFTWLTGG